MTDDMNVDKDRLKELYKFLIEDKKDDLQHYHDKIKTSFEEVENIKEEHKEELLFRLLCGDLGVASSGSSPLKHATVKEKLRTDANFHRRVLNMVEKPTQDNYDSLVDNWKSSLDQSVVNYQHIHRAVGACADKVSVVASQISFDKTFNWLQNEQIIPLYPSGFSDNWFAKNTWLMEQIHRVFEGETNNYQTIKEDENSKKIWLSLFIWAINEAVFNVQLIHDESAPNMIFYGPPGTGKTYGVFEAIENMKNLAKLGIADEIEVVHHQFHPSYTYEDFIEGIKPQGVTADGNIKFGLVNGHFKTFCMKAKAEPKKNFYFIVDEINRANLSAVFGETLSLLEKDYRHNPNPENPNDKNNLLKTQYAAMGNESDAYEWIGGEAYFGVPKNVFFIGMMNDVDKSIDTFDLALRRRFKWIRKDCDYDVIKNYTYFKNNESFANIDNYVACAEKLNNYISEDLGLGKSYEFGHSFFVKMSDLAEKKSITKDNLTDLFNLYLRPTLKEYLRALYSENEIEGKNGKLSEALKIFQGRLETNSEGKNEAK